MIEELKSDAIIQKVGGKFRLTALIQRRWVQLLQGARPMVETKGLTTMETIVREIMAGKIEAESPPPSPAKDEED